MSLVESGGVPEMLADGLTALPPAGDADGLAANRDATSLWRPAGSSSGQTHGGLVDRGPDVAGETAYLGARAPGPGPEPGEHLGRRRPPRGGPGGLALACTDAACFAVAVLASHSGVPRPRFGTSAFGVLALGTGAWVLSFEVMGLHAPRRFCAGEEIRRIIGAAGIGLPLVLLAGLWPGDSLRPTEVGLTWLLAVGLEVASRTGPLRLERLWGGSRREKKVRTLIVGPREEAIRLADWLQSASTRFEPLGYMEPADVGGGSDGAAGTREAGRLGDVMRAGGVGCLFVSPAVAANGVLPVVRAGREEQAEVRVFTQLPAILSSRVSVEPVGGYATLCFKPVRLSGPKAAVKRAFDVVVATVALLAALPVMAAAAVAIRLTSRGPVLYRQARVTRGGHVFTMYKFRTMVVGDGVDDAAPPIDPTVAYFKLREDPRIFRVGRFLRSVSIDELPQLLNVIRGDMSLVGPRPLWVLQVADNLELLAVRHKVRAGITGWWQVNGRSDISPEQAFGLDAAYVENWSLSLDLYILLRTVGAVLSRRGAY